MLDEPALLASRTHALLDHDGPFLLTLAADRRRLMPSTTRSTPSSMQSLRHPNHTSPGQGTGCPRTGEEIVAGNESCGSEARGEGSRMKASFMLRSASDLGSLKVSAKHLHNWLTVDTITPSINGVHSQACVCAPSHGTGRASSRPPSCRAFATQVSCPAATASQASGKQVCSALQCKPCAVLFKVKALAPVWFHFSSGQRPLVVVGQRAARQPALQVDQAHQLAVTRPASVHAATVLQRPKLLPNLACQHICSMTRDWPREKGSKSCLG
eukprot:1158984-Pelagomonas_calceolata.AAC.1